MNADLYAAWRNDGLERLSVIYEDGSFSIERIMLDPEELVPVSREIIRDAAAGSSVAAVLCGTGFDPRDYGLRLSGRRR